MSGDKDSHERYDILHADVLFEDVWAEENGSGCSECGESLSGAVNRCPTCGARVDVCSGSCSSCGARVCVGDGEGNPL